MSSIVHNSRPPGGHSMSKKSTPAGIAGNASHDGIPMRQWASRSYSATTGRPASSLGDQYGRGSPSTTHAENLSNQIPDGWGRDRRATTDTLPVRTREFTRKVVD
jgi:hypothetical protein